MSLRATVEPLVAKLESGFGTEAAVSIEVLVEDLPAAMQREILPELIHTELELRLRAGDAARVEQYLARFPEIAADLQLTAELAETELAFRRHGSDRPTPEEIRARFRMLPSPECDRLIATLPEPEQPVWPLRLSCPHCNEPISGSGADRGMLECPSCGGSVRIEADRNLTWEARRLPKLGRFQLLEVVGRGSFGTVYRARDTELDRLVAVKVPRSGSFSSADDEDRFVREGRSVARLSHPGIVPVFEVGRTSEFPYIVAEFVDGITLDDAIVDRRIGLSDAAELTAEIALTLDHVHRNGVVHRDLKPSNIILQPIEADERDSDAFRQGHRGSSAPAGDARRSKRLHPRLMDFGLARLEQSDGTLTLDNQILGTPAWMSPEQASGQGHAADGRSDLYSVGVILYQLLTGDPPFRGNARMLRFQVLHDEPVPPRRLNDRIPRDLETICLTAMARDPARRYQTGADLASDLFRFLRREPIEARPVTSVERVWRFVRRNALVSALTALIAVLLLTGTVVSTMFAIQASAARNRLDVQLRLNELQTELKTASFSAPELSELDAAIDRIRDLSPADADMAAEAVATAWGQRLTQTIRSVRVLNQDIINALHSDIGDLTERSPQRGRQTRQLMEQSLRAPVKLIDVSESWQDVFPEQRVEPTELDHGMALARSKVDRADASLLVPTQITGRGDQQMDATFHGPLSEAENPFGLILSFRLPSEDRTVEESYHGYAFVVDPVNSDSYEDVRRRLQAEDGPATPAAAPSMSDSNGSLFAMRIFRGDVLLRQEFFVQPATEDTVSLSAFRSGQELTFVVNSQHRVRFRDVLSPDLHADGVFALSWPEGLSVRDLRAWGLVQSPAGLKGSPLLAADRAFAEQQWQAALAAYRDAEQQSELPELRQEAVFRQGLCLLQTDPDLATRIFSRLAADETVSGSVWPLSAACQWWLLLLQDGDFEGADNVLTLLASRESSASPTFEQLAALLPLSVRNSIVARYLSAGTTGGYDAIRPHPGRQENIERIVRLHEMIRVPEREIVIRRNALARIYMEEQRYSEAQRVWEEILKSDLAQDPEYAVGFADFLDCCIWNLLLLDQPETALALLDEFQLPWDGDPEHEPRLVAIMRARILAAQGDHAAALSLVLPLLEAEHTGLLHQATRAQAYLVAGFLYEDLGQPDAARQAWQDGLQFIRDENYYGEFTIAASLLCSLSGDMSLQDSDQLIAGVLNHVSATGLSSVVLSFANSGVMPRQLLHGILSNLWSSERGRPFAHGIVMQQLDYDRSNYVQVLLCGFLAWRHSLTNVWNDSVPLTDDESEVIWRLCEESFVAYRRQDLTEAQVITLAMVHIGQPFLWLNTRESVPPRVRGALDYAHGCQYRRHLMRPDEARQFLEWAQADAAAAGDDLLRRLATQELAQLD